MTTFFSSKDQRHLAGRLVASLLRQADAKDSLKADEYGFVDIQLLCQKATARNLTLTPNHVKEIVDKDPQIRFTIARDRIRANSGHRYNVRMLTTPETPPEVLYHGTSPQAAESIMHEGIRKMGKAYVHLADTVERAHRIGLRKCENPTILTIRAQEAHTSGISFWRSGQKSSDGEIFLSDEIPAKFIELAAE